MYDKNNEEEYIKITYPSEKHLEKEKRNKRKSKIFQKVKLILNKKRTI